MKIKNLCKFFIILTLLVLFPISKAYTIEEDIEFSEKDIYSDKRLQGRAEEIKKAAQKEQFDRKMTYEFLEVMLEELGLRDMSSLLHSLEVESLAVAMAKQMGLDEATTQILKEMCRYHDLGKYFVPPRILTDENKPQGKDWEIMAGHAKYFNLVSLEMGLDINNIKHILEGCITHHEGKGYYMRVKNNELSICAQILRTIDQYEAMTSATRKYRIENGKPVGMPHEKVMSILRDNANKGLLNIDCVNALDNAIKDKLWNRKINDLENLKKLSPEALKKIYKDRVNIQAKKPDELKDMFLPTPANRLDTPPLITPANRLDTPPLITPANRLDTPPLIFPDTGGNRRTAQVEIFPAENPNIDTMVYNISEWTEPIVKTATHPMTLIIAGAAIASYLCPPAAPIIIPTATALLLVSIAQPSYAMVTSLQHANKWWDTAFLKIKNTAKKVYSSLFNGKNKKSKKGTSAPIEWTSLEEVLEEM